MAVGHRAVGALASWSEKMSTRSGSVGLSLALLGVVTMSCAPAAPATSPAGPNGGAQVEREPRTAVIALNSEPAGLAALNPGASGFGANFAVRPFSAFLELVDERGNGRPYLAEGLPQLNTDTWRVFPDGRMETRYRLKPNLTWHDRAPLSADDFAFAWRVYTTPEVGVPQGFSAPISIMEEVLAPDSTTVVITWKRLYPDANLLQSGGSTNLGLAPLPKHILEGPYAAANWDTFPNLPFWTTEFVGLGPYRLDRWEAGAFIEGVAFDGHVLGRPKIDRIRLVPYTDRNTAYASMRAGAYQLASQQVLTFEQALNLKREWDTTNGGAFLFTPASTRHFLFQFRPEFLGSRALMDVRVRRALAHSLDKVALSDALWSGEGVLLDSIFSPQTDYFPVIDRAIVKYPYDVRVTERLMGEAGFARGADGFYTSPGEGRLSFDVRATVGPESESERSTAASGWRQAGFDVTESALSIAQFADGMARASFEGMTTNTQSAPELTMSASFVTSQTARPENRWNGINRGGWSNAEYDRAVEAFNTVLDPNERTQQRAAIARIFSEELPGVILYFNLNVHPRLAALTGPGNASAVSTLGVAWNMHEWEMR
ncbi:MAG: hypothetical protein HW416_283 [Chloroflexi bacterium]|nr:hypothetical protein [Chloroflexota bacterium]